jgi:hypothetical protein
MGFDPDTGQILDPAAFARWQKQEQERRRRELQEQPAMGVFEAFLTARRALADCVDADSLKSLVVAGDLDGLRRTPQVQELLGTYQGYGPVMAEKLCKHLEFLVENRRKFYADFAV